MLAPSVGRSPAGCPLSCFPIYTRPLTGSPSSPGGSALGARSNGRGHRPPLIAYAGSFLSPSPWACRPMGREAQTNELFGPLCAASLQARLAVEASRETARQRGRPGGEILICDQAERLKGRLSFSGRPIDRNGWSEAYCRLFHVAMLAPVETPASDELLHGPARAPARAPEPAD